MNMRERAEAIRKELDFQKGVAFCPIEPIFSCYNSQFDDAIEAALLAVRKEENEACAKVAEETIIYGWQRGDCCPKTAFKAASLIRKRIDRKEGE